MRKFNVGDRVSVTELGERRYADFGATIPAGTTGTIVPRNDDDHGDEPGIGVVFDVAEGATYSEDVPWNVYYAYVDLVEEPAPSTTTTTPSDVTRIIGAQANNLRLDRHGDKVRVYGGKSCVATISIDQFRELVKSIEGEAK